MPSPTPHLTIDAARALVGDSALRAASPPSADRRVGIELEWLVFGRSITEPVPLPQLQEAVAAAGPLPGRGLVTYEPGGQLELSSRPASLRDVLALVDADAATLRVALADAGLVPVGLGRDPVRPLRRVLDTPRYAAMEAYFDTGGAEGRTMMRGTAALQVSLDTGTAAEIDHRWRRVHALGPLLLAMFANSPLVDGRPSGWRSSRWAVWNAIDAGRTAPVLGHGTGCADDWARYALAARVMLIQCDDDHAEPVLEPLTFAEWIERGHPLGWPTADDLTYHLSTLFPPVRPQGRFELRMVDALPEPWWRVAFVLTVALIDDPEAAAVAERATLPVRDRWNDGARDGLADPEFADAARTCFAAALPALARLGVGPATISAARAFAETYVTPGRTPADDRLDEWSATGQLLPLELQGAS